MKPRVTVSVGGETTEADEEGLTIVPSADALIILTGAEDVPVRLDGRLRTTYKAGDAKLIAIDLTRSTGFHHLHIQPGWDYWFGTEDAKLGLDGVTAMLAYMRDECRAWSGQLLFTDGSYMRDPHIMYGWLDVNADRLLHAVAAIARDPARRSVRNRILTPRASTRLSVAATLSLIRKNPKEYLEEMPEGPLQFGEHAYFPRRVIAYKRSQTLDTIANRRAVWLLEQLRILIEEVRNEITTEPERQRCVTWRNQIASLAATTALAPLYSRAASVYEAGGPVTEEVVDYRYSESYRGASALHDLSAWSATRIRQPAYSYVDYADAIYQAFVSSAIAEAFELEPTALALGLSQPAFQNEKWSLYFNVVPPSTVARTWRSYTGFPDRYRPDILLFHKESEQIILADAKYRSNAPNDGLESARKELEAYMAAFGLARVVMFYPPEPASPLELTNITWNGNRLMEVALGPREEAIPWLKDHVLPVLEEMAAPPRWRGAV